MKRIDRSMIHTSRCAALRARNALWTSLARLGGRLSLRLRPRLEGTGGGELGREEDMVVTADVTGAEKKAAGRKKDNQGLNKAALAISLYGRDRSRFSCWDLRRSTL